MGFRVKILFAQEFEGEIESPIVEEDRAQQGAFRFEVVRNGSVAGSRSRHRNILNFTRSFLKLREETTCGNLVQKPENL